MSDHDNNQPRALRRILGLMAGQRLLILGGIILALIATLSSIGLLMTAGWFITATALAGIAVGGAAAGGAIAFNFHFPSGFIRGFALSRTSGRYAERLVTHEATFRALTDLRLWLFARLIPQVPGPIGRDEQGRGLRLGDIMTRLTADIDALDNLYLRIIVPSTIALIVVIVVGAIMAMHSPLIAITTIVSLAIAAIAVPALTHRLGKARGEQLIQTRAVMRSDIADLSDGIAELAVYGATQSRIDAIAERNGDLSQQQIGMASIAGLGTSLGQFCQGLALLIGLIIGVMQYQAGVISGPVLAMILFGILACFEAVSPLSLAYQLLGQTRTAARRVLALADAPTAVTGDQTNTDAIDLKHGLSIEGVSFVYPSNDRPALDSLTLALEPGDRVAVVGSSGAGKSTLLGLLLKMHQPDQGEIRWGGSDLASLHPDRLYQDIGVLDQRPQLFAGTIRDNLQIGRANADEAAMMAVLRQVDLDDLVESLPTGLDTWLGEAGAKLSGGQSRRLALARLLLKDPALLLLDEPTEGLDPVTERAVVDELKTICAGRTVILITHRLAPLGLTNRVISLEAGCITGEEPADQFIERTRAAITEAIENTAISKPADRPVPLATPTPNLIEEPVSAPVNSAAEPSTAPQLEKLASWWLRPLYFGIGVFCLVLGLVGVFVPGLPTTIFLIIALWAFSRSSQAFHDWLWQHPRFGPSLKAWSEHRVVPRRAKIAAGLMMAASVAIMAALGSPLWVTILVAAICLGVMAYIAPKPEAPPTSE
ncbi:MAG: thiol reductant ABC exporter subunit CydC [Alphaproteobacteria bacterium]|nr:thiol reductant ABC exporter subunit CydC [Alphaproteobacteria bacterium SS10]